MAEVGRHDSPEPKEAEPLLSALVITFNERANIERCLSSLSFCDEIVVVDAESQDGTQGAARRFTDRVYEAPWRGYAVQKQRALDLSRGRWILWIDADEVVSPELARSIRRSIEAVPSTGDGIAGYRLQRRVNYLGRWIRHGGWGADWVLRLFLRERGRFSEDLIHEAVILAGPSRRLEGILEHYSYRDLSHHWQKIGEFSRLWAEQARSEGRRARPADLLFRPPVRFLKIFALRLGFLDGWRGLVIAGLAAAYVFLKYARLKEGESR
jgi:glycosyltransferase involved in cell wall biosynthesis